MRIWRSFYAQAVCCGTHRTEIPQKRARTHSPALQATSGWYDYGIAVLQEFSDEQLLETIAGPRYMGNVTRVKMAYFTLSHAMDIYGQMAVYLRLNGVTPPASRAGV